VRVFAASDVHGQHRFYERLPRAIDAARAEVLVLAGDLLGYPDGFGSIEEAQRADAREVCRHLDRVPVPVFYLMGNDDWVELECGNPAASLHARRVTCGQYNLVGYQYSLPFMGGIHEKPEEEILNDMRTIRRLVDEKTLFITHSPVRGILDSTQFGPCGSQALRDVVEDARVRAHIHGHIHGRFGRHGRHFNVACGKTMRAMAIDVASMTHAVVDLSSDAITVVEQGLDNGSSV